LVGFQDFKRYNRIIEGRRGDDSDDEDEDDDDDDDAEDDANGDLLEDVGEVGKGLDRTVTDNIRAIAKLGGGLFSSLQVQLPRHFVTTTNLK
jgi:hypothetical protein